MPFLSGGRQEAWKASGGMGWQLSSLQKLEGFGWNLQFVRRPLFQQVIPVMLHPDNGTLCVMRDDGTLDSQPDIQLRSE